MNRWNRALLAAGAAGIAGVAFADARWCLGFSGLGPIRAGMTVEQAMVLADWPAISRKAPAEACWVHAVSRAASPTSR